MDKLTLLIPAKEESESLPIVLDELVKYNLNKLVVLNENDFETKKVVKNYNCEYHFQTQNGYGSALIEGINKIKTEYLCIFNADGSFDPKYLEEMYNLCENGNDFVFSSRYSNGGRSEDDTILTYIGNKMFTSIGKLFFKLKVNDILYTFVMGKTSSFKNLNLSNKDFRFCVELPIKIRRKNLKYDNHGSFERKRFKGKKKVNEFKDGFLILLELIKLFFKR